MNFGSNVGRIQETKPISATRKFIFTAWRRENGLCGAALRLAALVDWVFA